MSETDAILLAQSGDAEAFSVLYSLHHRNVYARCLHILKQTDAAEDVSQEVFILLWRKINKFQHRSSFATWLYRITTNQCLSHLRSCKTHDDRRVYFDGEGDDAPSMPVPIDPHNTLLRLELEQVWQRLTPQERALIELDMEGFNSTEVADAAGWGGKSTARTHTRKAYGTLRTALA